MFHNNDPLKLQRSKYLASSPRGGEAITKEKISVDDIITDREKVQAAADVLQENCKFDHSHFVLIQ